MVWALVHGEELPAEKDVAQLAQPCIGVSRFRIRGVGLRGATVVGGSIVGLLLGRDNVCRV